MNIEHGNVLIEIQRLFRIHPLSITGGGVIVIGLNE